MTSGKTPQPDWLQAAEQLFQRLAQRVQAGVGLGLGASAGDQAYQLLEAGATVLGQLAPEQVE